MLTSAHIQPLAALVGGVLILLVPRLLNYIVAILFDPGRAHGPRPALSLIGPFERPGCRAMSSVLCPQRTNRMRDHHGEIDQAFP